MSNQAKIWISLFVAAFDIGLVIYVLTSLSLSPPIIVATAAFMTLSSVHVVLIIWFGDKWHSSPEFRSFLRSLGGPKA